MYVPQSDVCNWKAHVVLQMCHTLTHHEAFQINFCRCSRKRHLCHNRRDDLMSVNPCASSRIANTGPPMLACCLLTPWLMEPEGSMPHSQGLSNNPYPESNEPVLITTPLISTLMLPSHLRLCFPRSNSCRFTC